MYKFECCHSCGIVFNLRLRKPIECPNCKTKILFKEKLIGRNRELLEANEKLINKSK
jgi:DNA-directed RNA polymerase subunit RPC12/RpoP